MGSLTAPSHLSEDSQGRFSNVSSPEVTRPLTGKWESGAVVIMVGHKPNRDRMTLQLRDPDHLSVNAFHGFVPSWNLERKSGINGDERGK